MKIIVKLLTRVFSFKCKFMVMHVLVLIVEIDKKIYTLLDIDLAKTYYNLIY